MIDDLLKQLGFSDKEIRIYLTVLENGKISPSTISTITGIKRPTVYSVGKELLKKGVMTQDMEGPGGYFVALPPANLDALIKKEERTISEKKKIIGELVGELENIPKSKSYSVPKMRFIDEHNVSDFLYRQTPVWEENMIATKNPTWWGFQDHTLVDEKNYGAWIQWYWDRIPKEIDLKLISNDFEAEAKMKTKVKNIERRHIKFWKKDFNFTTTNWILGEYVVFVMSKQHPHYIVEIHDAVYAENMRQVFRNLWDVIGK